MSGSNLELWKATYDAETQDQLNEAYKLWCTDYDRDCVQGMGYVGPMTACRMLDTYLESPESRVLDAGCGTGLVGQVLSKHGYGRVDAMDISKDMLQVAKEKDVYNKFFQADMSEPLEVLNDDTYDASICVGTFTYKHVGPEAFNELIRVTKPGGYVCFTIRDGAYQEYGYRKRMHELEADNQWELLEMAKQDYLIKEGVTAKFCVYRVGNC
ncbi:class I SAM-dependent DNA methyltransferase [Oceanidesulfovibrio marinus]|uniref:Class I SAM-dependent methyltransferase n=1 Tax=Oceanidesulfovibrio marinus TaxID=370038 RepID=A0A6P1ZLS4_9BACT|nr:class I SAM-dependent methyltransferase [Oceanidesulfovibrio marinus]TVM36743.1 class I SAM-dependent methyltransferase [Oceanidesulfovibrio marinus]